MAEKNATESAPPEKPKTAQPISGPAKANSATQPRTAQPAAAKAAAAGKIKQARAAADRPAEEEHAQEQEPSAFQVWLRESPSVLTSLVVHMALLLILALWTFSGYEEENNELTFNTNVVEEQIEEMPEEEFEEIEIDVEQFDTVVDPSPSPIVVEQPVEAFEEMAAAPMSVELDPIGLETAPQTDLMSSIGTGTSGSGLSGRGEAARSRLVATGGGSPASEEAVARALKWLAEHQLPDGGWNFDHRGGRCQGRCSHPGTLDKARTGATAMALLPFLGAGQTHVEGDYKEVVKAGLYYLVSQMKVSQAGGDLRGAGGGRMYAHGLAAICLTEAYGMTQDQALRQPAQAAVNFIVYAQDPVGGGWRYSPKQPGDTSVVGWQLMALKSAHMAYLHVPDNTIRGASQFLDSVQVDAGSAYGYTDPGRGPATTAVGLLCRMYLGWKKDHEALQRGVARLAKEGPSFRNAYRDYYAAQVMFQTTGAKGEVWEKWNTKMRDTLVEMQAKDGHEFGSWAPRGGHGERAGRLYSTSMSTMILEVYYRHMPIFKEQATQHEFPL